MCRNRKMKLRLGAIQEQKEQLWIRSKGGRLKERSRFGHSGQSKIKKCTIIRRNRAKGMNATAVSGRCGKNAQGEMYKSGGFDTQHALRGRLRDMGSGRVGSDCDVDENTYWKIECFWRREGIT